MVVTTPSNDPTTPQQPEPGYVPPTVQLPPNSPYAAGGYPPPGTMPPPVNLPPGAAYAYPGMPMVDAYGRPVSDKSKLVAGLLQLLLPFGIGRFYIGDTKTGVLQAIVTVFTCGLGHIWSIIDGVLILANGGTDAQGRVLRD
jgi:TM2 domain-containing membrane protein YozV